jgi:hypothetical protein
MFAAGKSASAGKLTTQTFTSDTTWVAPIGTNVLLTMSGYGGPATPDAYYPNQPIVVSGTSILPTAGLPNPPFGQWATLYAKITDAAAIVAANSGVNNLSFSPAVFFYNVGTDDTYNISSASGTNWVSGNSYTIAPYIGSPLTSGNITYAQGYNSWALRADVYGYGQNGAATTGVSKTFPGGTLTGTEPYRTTVAAVTTNFTNVPVTPGASYPIVVPAGGSLTITYIG